MPIHKIVRLELAPYPMNFIAPILIGMVAAEHLYILWMEMFAWTTKGPKRAFAWDPFPVTTENEWTINLTQRRGGAKVMHESELCAFAPLRETLFGARKRDAAKISGQSLW